MKIDLQKLREELKKAPAYEPPEKGAGYRYVYERLYLPFIQGRKIRLGTLDFEAFSSEDVLTLDKDYCNSFSRRLDRNDSIRSELRRTAPLPSAAMFL